MYRIYRRFRISLSAKFTQRNCDFDGKVYENHFEFFGIKSKLRKDITKEIWKKHKTEVKDKVREIGWQLFKKKRTGISLFGYRNFNQRVEK